MGSFEELETASVMNVFEDLQVEGYGGGRSETLPTVALKELCARAVPPPRSRTDPRRSRKAKREREPKLMRPPIGYRMSRGCDSGGS
jgi:hypothetical protein